MFGMTFLPCLERSAWGALVLADRFRSRLFPPPRPPSGTLAAQSSGSQGRLLWGGLTSSALTWAQGMPQPPQTDNQLEFLAWPCPALPECLALSPGSARAWLPLTNSPTRCSSAGPRVP